MRLNSFILGCVIILVSYLGSSGQICTPGANGYQLIDFDQFQRGERINNQFTGVTFASSSGYLVAFETATPTQPAIPGDPSNGDPDMGSPNEAFGGPGIGAGGYPSNDTYLGKVLIIEEHWRDQNGDGYDDYPDDLGGGGVITLTFDEPTTVGVIEFLDDIDVTVDIEYFGGGTGQFSYSGPGDNAFGFWDINADPNNDARNIQKLTFNLVASGGIVSIETCTDYASVGDFVWHDLNANGIQDSGEPGIGGATVYLLDENENRIGNTTTAMDGSYAFENINTGTYSIEFTLPNGYINVTNNNQGSDVTKDSDADPNTLISDQFVLNKLDYNRTIDAGFYQSASIGNRVWDDRNVNGIQERGEDGVQGITVNLYRDTDGDGNPDGGAIDSKTTDANGNYEFTNLLPGDYVVEFSGLPTDYVFTNQDIGNDASDSDANPSTGRTETLTVVSGQNDPSYDAGIYQLASLGDYVWIDTNGDGIQDGSELGLNGVTVNLYEDFDGDGSPDGPAIDNTTTVSNGGNDGYYEFTGLQPEGYIVEFVEPAGYSLSSNDQGGNDNLDSDADPISGRTATIELISGENDPSIDAGLYQGASLGNYIFDDQNGNDFYDSGDLPVEGITVNLYEDFDGDGSPDGGIILTQTTGANGLYLFENLRPGGYIVELDNIPGGYDLVTPNVGGNTALDSDFDKATQRTTTMIIESGQSNLDLDGGIVSALLPVELIAFNGEMKAKAIQLSWATGSEINNDYFIVERSFDGSTFAPIAQISGVGNSNEISHYQLMDEQPLLGANYYRLKQVDYDGKYDYSDIIVVDNDEEVTWNVFPNPTTDRITISTNGTLIQRVEVYTVQGHLLWSEPVTSSPWKQEITYDLSGLTPGHYLLMFRGEQFNSSELIVKK